MARQLKIYTALVTVSDDSRASLGSSRGTDVAAFVAATSARQAQALFGISPGEWSMSGSVSSRERHSVALDAPGQVFIESVDCWRRPVGIEPVKAGLVGRRLVAGAASSLEMANEIIEADRAAAVRRKERAVADRQERLDQRSHAAETKRQIIESLHRSLPAMERLGIVPRTVSLGATDGRQGVLVPAETFEMLLRLAEVGDRTQEE